LHVLVSPRSINVGFGYAKHWDNLLMETNHANEL
jgi:hypothetical protein